MRIIAEKHLQAYWQEYVDARPALQNWRSMTRAASWGSMSEVVRSAHGSPSPVSNDRVVFNIHGNAHRLVAAIDFKRQCVFIKFIGTHAEYDEIDAATVSRF